MLTVISVQYDQRVRPGHPVPDHEALVLIGAVPAEERFHRVAVTNDEAGCQHDLGHVVDVAHRDQIFEPVSGANRNRQRQHHREAGIDRAGDEVRREDGGVPPGQHRHREVEADDGVDREHQRRRDAGENQRRDLIPVPVTRRSAPAEREHAEDHLLRLRHRAISHRREVGNQADVPEHDRHGRVGRDREDVPDERASELWPQSHRVGIREQPIRCQPRPTGVDQREHRGAQHGEDRHGFGEAADRHAPLLPEEQQNRRDQGAGVADADPPDEVDDVEGPADRDVVAPDPDAPEEQIAERQVQSAEQRQPDQEAEHPAERGALRQRDLRNRFGDGLEVVSRSDHRADDRGRVRLQVNVVRHQCRSPPCWPSPGPCVSTGCPPTGPAHGSAGFGLRTAARYVVRGRVLRSSRTE